MKNILLIIALFWSGNLLAQNSALNFELGNGINLDYDEGNYVFNIGGFIQPAFQIQQIDSLQSTNRFGIRRAFFNFSQEAKKEKFGFMIRADFADNFPLLDAYITYKPFKVLTLTFGQQQTFTNNREMMQLESQLRYGDRSLLSQTFSESGREFGLFAEGKFEIGSMGISPKVAITSGDGRNSFGTSSTDIDKGGLRYGGRLDVYPLGFFTDNNDVVGVDITHSEDLKIVVGAAYSVNYGVSNSVGEGHGNFFFYDENRDEALPNYWKQAFDVLIKWKGISLLGEFVNTSSNGLINLYTDPNATLHLQNGEISEYLTLGQGYNVQVGYLTKNGLSLDLGYSQLTPEFSDETNSILQDTNAFTVGLSKYLIDNWFKIQANYTTISYNVLGVNRSQGEIVIQLVF